MTYISCFSDFAFCFYYYFMENCHTWIIISKWQNDLHTNTSRSVWPILYGLMIKMLQYKMYPAGELAVLRQLLFQNGGKNRFDSCLPWKWILSHKVFSLYRYMSHCLQLYMYRQHVFPLWSGASLFAANILQVCTVQSVKALTKMQSSMGLSCLHNYP